MKKSILLNSKELTLTIERLACQLIENNGDFLNTVAGNPVGQIAIGGVLGGIFG